MPLRDQFSGPGYDPLLTLLAVVGIFACITFFAIESIRNPCEFDNTPGCREAFAGRGPPYKDVRLRDDIFYVPSRNWNTNRLEWLSKNGADIQLDRESPHSDRLAKEQQIVILVHGFRALDVSVD